ncbi:DUF2946 domain-containing protein [Dyella sp. 20L07]|uniref:DUF2946 domain-containing protein n=1 Tax=Dyella sp. 20L07 TaxID=3384240 RepID=UPI003D2CAD20
MPHVQGTPYVSRLMRSCLEPTLGFGGLGMQLSRSRTPRRFVAWLAVAAMWLLVAAPTVSRTLPSAWSWPDLGAWCTGHGLSDQHPAAPSSPDDPALHADKCDYCALLGHSPLLTGGASAVSVTTWLPPLAPAVRINSQWYALPLLSANPRGPPSFLPG